MALTVKAKAKINWSLRVLGQREDGYHLLDMFMQTVSLYDELELEKAEENTLFVNGVLSEDGQNLVLRAARLLQEYTGYTGGARMHLTKRIPSRAGLGGGSADCAATLKALNSLWDLKVSEKTLETLALKLGADVPFCLNEGLARVQGIGEKIERFHVNWSVPVVLWYLAPGLGTAEVFTEWDNMKTQGEKFPISAQEAIIRGDWQALKELTVNDLEKPAIQCMPEILQAKQKLEELGATFVRMSGSGSTVYGVFPDSRTAIEAQKQIGQDAFFVWTEPTNSDEKKDQ